MRKYRKLAETLADAGTLADRQPELVKELLLNVWLVEANYPDDENAVVLLLESEGELPEAEKAWPVLRGLPPEIDDVRWNDDDTGFTGHRKIVWVTGQDGSGIVALAEVRYRPANSK